MSQNRSKFRSRDGAWNAEKTRPDEASLTRRALLCRIAGVGAASLGVTLAVESAAEAQAILGLPVTQMIAPRANTVDGINQQVRAVEAQGGGVVVVSGDGQGGTYGWQHQLVIPSNVHVIFTNDIRFIVRDWLGPLAPLQQGRPDYAIRFETGASNASVTNCDLDLDARLIAVSTNDDEEDEDEVVERGGAAVLALGVSNVSINHMLLSNQRADLGDPNTAAIPSDGVRIQDSNDVSVAFNTFRDLHIAVNVRNSEEVNIDFNRFWYLLDSRAIPEAVAEEGAPVPATQDAFGGAFVQMTGICKLIRIRDNINPFGLEAFRENEVGGSVVLTSPAGLQVPALPPFAEGQAVAVQDPLPSPALPAHEFINVERNVFRSNQQPSLIGVPNGSSGDVIALKNVRGFLIDDNRIHSGGEFGIVVSHGSNLGLIINNTVLDTDGSGIVVGAANKSNENPEDPDDPAPPYFQTNPEVFNIDVLRNTLWGCGRDRGGDLGRYRAQPLRAASANYPNTLGSIRIWNARDILVSYNCVMEYRSSGIWVKFTFDDQVHRAYNAVTDLTIDDSNVLEPYRRGPVFNEATAALLAVQVAAEPDDAIDDDRVDAQPYTGISRVEEPDVNGVQSFAPDEPFVRGFNASRYVGPPKDDEDDEDRFIKDTPENPWFDTSDIDEVVVRSGCLAAGNGRIDVFLFNKECDAASYSVQITTPDASVITLPPDDPSTPELDGVILGALEQTKLTRTLLSNGMHTVEVLRDGVAVNIEGAPSKQVTIAC